MSKLKEVSTQLSLLDWQELKPVDLQLLTPDEIYNSDDQDVFTGLSEDQRFERKSSKIRPNDLAEDISAFGNDPYGEGGVIAIGITNDKEIEGCAHLTGEQVADLMQLGRDRCQTGKFIARKQKVINKNGEDDFIILARVYYVEDRLVELTDGSSFVRFQDENKTLGDFEKQEIRINKGEISFERQKCGLTYPDQFRTSDVRKFVSLVRNAYGGLAGKTDEQILELYHLGQRTEGNFVPNNACAILFADDLRGLFPGAYIHFLRYDGEQARGGREINVIKDRQIDGTIFDIIINSAAQLDSQLREFTAFDKGKFYSVPEYPKDAWYELIVNACAHRSYHIRNAPIFIRMFDDQLIVESPGGFMPQVTPETIYQLHRPRNPVIMRVLREFGEVRCFNEGTSRIRYEMNRVHLPDPVFKQVDNNHASVRVTLVNNIHNRKNSLDSEAYRAIGDALALSLDDDDKKIINYVMTHETVNVSEALRIIKTTRWGTASEKLEKLRNRGILEKHKARTERGKSWYYLPKPKDTDGKKEK